MIFITESHTGRATVKVAARLADMQPLPSGGGVLDGGPRPWVLTGPLLEPTSLTATFEAYEDGYRAISVRVSGPRHGAVGADVFRQYDYEAASVDGFDVSRDEKMPEELRTVLDVLRPRP